MDDEIIEETTVRFADPSRPNNGWSFAQAVLGNAPSNVRCTEADSAAAPAGSGWLARISTEHRRKLAKLAAADDERRQKPDLQEWVGQILSEDWDPAKHPRGGFPENRGWFSPTWGGVAGAIGAGLAGIAAWLDSAGESPNAQAPWYDENKNKSDVIAKIRGRNTTIHFENTTKEYRGKLADVVKKAFNAVDSINDDIKKGTLTKDSPEIKTCFGNLTDKQFDRVKKVFEKVADAPNHDGALTIRSEKQDKGRVVAENDIIGLGINPRFSVGWRSSRVMLYPRFFHKQTDDQVARYVHELTHEGANTDDNGYWDDIKQHYVDRDGNEVKLTTDQKVNNANNYERLVRSRLTHEGTNR